MPSLFCKAHLDTDLLSPLRRAITRGQLLRAHSSYLPPAAFVALRSHLAENYINGSFLKEPPTPEGTTAAPKPNPLEDPAATEAMLDGLKDMMSKQAAGFIPQVRVCTSRGRVKPEPVLESMAIALIYCTHRWRPCTLSTASSHPRSSVRRLGNQNLSDRDPCTRGKADTLQPGAEPTYSSHPLPAPRPLQRAPPARRATRDPDRPRRELVLRHVVVLFMHVWPFARVPTLARRWHEW